MDVAVIIPLYNGARWIEDTLRSVLAQSHCPREVVVVDDGSDDGSKEIVRSAFPEVTLLQNPREGGKGAGPVRRFGVRHTTAPLVTFLDQDDLWHSDHLRILTGLMRRTEYPAAVSGLDHFLDSSSPSYDLEADEVDLFSPWERYPLNSIHSPSCVVIRREALDWIGGWPDQFVISDMHAWFKLTTEAPMVRTEKVSVGKRVHDDSYLARLRTKDASKFLQRHIRVCEDALAFRKEVTSEGERVFQDRLEIFRRLGEALEGVKRGEIELLRETALFLEQESQIEQGRVRAYWFFLLRLFSMPKSQIPKTDTAKQRQLLGRIVRGWPNRGRRARRALSRALIQTISYKAFLTYGLLTPIQAVTSLLFLECMVMELERAVDRLSESIRASIDAVWGFAVEQMQICTAAVKKLRPRS